VARKKTNRLNISKAVKRPGALTAKAKAAGKSVSRFITDTLKAGSKASKLTKQQARFAKTLRKITRKRK